MNLFGDPILLPADEVASAGADEPMETPFAVRYPLNILIADDSYIDRRVLFLLLERLGYTPVTTDNGRQCLAAVFRDIYNVLLIDLDMPEMSGLECALSIRHAGFKFPIIAVSGRTPHLTQDQCSAAGMNGFMAKPVKIADLKQLLRAVTLRKKRTPPVSHAPVHHMEADDSLLDARATVRISMSERRPVS